MKGLALAAGVVIAVGCGGSASPQVDAANVLRDGGAAMGQLTSVTATLKLTKGTITLQGFTLVSARTSVRLPADSDTTYVVKEQDVSFQIEVVIVDGHVFLQVPFSPFQELNAHQAGQLPDMAKLFDPSTGLPAVIPAGSSPKYVSSAQVGGKATYEVSTSYTPDQVRSLLASLSSSGPVAATIWVGVSDHLVRKALLDGAFGDGGKEAAVEVDITGFNAAVTIASPTRTT